MFAFIHYANSYTNLAMCVILFLYGCSTTDYVLIDEYDEAVDIISKFSRSNLELEHI